MASSPCRRVARATRRGDARARRPASPANLVGLGTSLLDEALKTAIQDAYRAWLGARGFAPRRGQREMIAGVARALAGEAPRIALIEAGTGTGKTASYLLAALPVAQATGKTVVIGTATVALQEQVALRDLPDLAANAGLAFDHVLAKGRRRYVCPKRLDEALDPASQGAADLFGFDAGHRQLHAEMRHRFDNEIWNGERDAWPFELDERAWFAVTTDHRGCTNRRCRHFKRCPFFVARERVAEVDVVVANHDLILSDLALGGGIVLSDPADTIYLFDEAHHLAPKAQAHGSRSLGVVSTGSWLDQASRTLSQVNARVGAPDKCVAALGDFERHREDATERLRLLEEALRNLPFDAEGGGGPSHERSGVDGSRRAHASDAEHAAARDVRHAGARNARRAAGTTPRAHLRFAHGRPSEDLVTLCANASPAFAGLGTALARVLTVLDRAVAGDDDGISRDDAEPCLALMGPLLARAEASAALLDDYAASLDDGPVTARWAARRDSEVELHATPLLPGDALDDMLWSRCHGAVCTSATLTALGRFDRFVEAVGVPADAPRIAIPSPFDYPRIATLAVPRMRSVPRDAKAHTDEIIELLPDLLDAEAGGALVLFSSWRQLNDVDDALGTGLGERLQVQGKASKQTILEQHCARIDAGEASCIFGVASFAEGVDLPDDYCRHVVITKLPFAVPDDPVSEATTEWVEKQGRNAFFEVTVPDATLRLVQACGRLIRHERDHGRITILDRRLLQQRYGQQMLDSLPPFRREFR